MIIVPLTVTELQILDYVATRRYIATSNKGKEMKQDPTRSPWEIVLDGVYGEYAVAKHFNLFIDLNCDYRKFGADLEQNDGSTIDVKSTRRTGGPLNATEWAIRKPADIFILTEIYDTEVHIVGWIDRATFLVDSNKHQLKDRDPYYCLPQEYLKVFNDKKRKKTL